MGTTYKAVTRGGNASEKPLSRGGNPREKLPLLGGNAHEKNLAWGPYVLGTDNFRSPPLRTMAQFLASRTSWRLKRTPSDPSHG
jgi:hypothetical protein